MKDISEIKYTVEDLKEGKLTRASMIEDFEAIRFEAGLVKTALEHGMIDGEYLNDESRELCRAIVELESSINYCWEHDCFGGGD